MPAAYIQVQIQIIWQKWSLDDLLQKYLKQMWSIKTWPSGDVASSFMYLF